MDDSFAKKMEVKALLRFQKYSEWADDRNCNESKLEINKENIDYRNDSAKDGKPMIAEHLTLRKTNLDDEINPELSMQAYTFNENEDDMSNEDRYVKNCKNRLATLAGKFRKFEEEDGIEFTNKSPTNKRPISGKRRSNEQESDSNEASSVKSSKIGHEPSAARQRNEIIQDPFPQKEMKTNAILDKSVIKSLEAQGYIRTESDAHLRYNFKSNIKNSPLKNTLTVSAVKKQTPEIKSSSVNVHNLRSANSKFATNLFVQNSAKKEEHVDPSLLSVAERRKLFEKRMMGIEEPADSPKSVQLCINNSMNYDHDNYADEEKLENSESEKFDESNSDESADMYADNESDSDIDTDNQNPEDIDTDNKDSNDIDSDTKDSNDTNSDNKNPDIITDKIASWSAELNTKEVDSKPDVSPKSDTKMNISEIMNASSSSALSVVQSVKQVKFVSTPKPGCLYPSVADLEGEPIDDNNSPGESEISSSHDTSFCRDMFQAAENIFSFHNSVECSTETASFTFSKNYSNTSLDLSQLSQDHSNSKTEETNNKEMVDENVTDETDNCGSTDDYIKKIEMLEQVIVKENSVFSQAVHALKFCMQKPSFLNSVSHLEAEKLLLISQMKIAAAQNEISRMKIENTVHPQSSEFNLARGCITISNIKLPVRMEIIHEDIKDNVFNNLLCVAKCGDFVQGTEVVPVLNNKILYEQDNTYILMPDTIRIPNIGSDFKITVEVYNLIVKNPDQNGRKPCSTKKEKKLQRSVKKEKDTRVTPRTSRTTDKKRIQSSFYMIGYMIFSLNEIKRRHWILNKQDLYHTPLVGMIMMDLKSDLAKTSVQKHGFLTIYEIVTGLGAWTRYWFYLKNDKMLFWKYPEDESTKDPIGVIDMKKCTSLIETVGIEITARPCTFILQFNQASYLQKFCNINDDRLLLSADDMHERSEWCRCLNEVLRSLRLWLFTDE